MYELRAMVVAASEHGVTQITELIEQKQMQVQQKKPSPQGLGFLLFILTSPSSGNASSPPRIKTLEVLRQDQRIP